MNYSLRFVFLFSLIVLFSSCKSHQATKNDLGQLRYSGEQGKEDVNISDLINENGFTLICIRHAEKESTPDNPSLTAEGKQRAKDLSDLLTTIDVDAIYSSDYNRTIETVQPLSDRTNLPIRIYNPRQLNELKNTIVNDPQNMVVVIAGHSNSTPSFVNELLAEDKYDSFDESDYDNIFIVAMDAEQVNEVDLLEYGEVSAVSSK